MGPLGFALALQPLAEHLQREGNLIWSAWYLDDGILVGNAYSIAWALAFLESTGKDIGLQLNPGKCVLWGP